MKTCCWLKKINSKTFHSLIETTFTVLYVTKLQSISHLASCAQGVQRDQRWRQLTRLKTVDLVSRCHCHSKSLTAEAFLDEK